jgi:hypothetical protein
MVLAAPSRMQMRGTYLPITVSSSDMNPRVISSAHAKVQKRVKVKLVCCQERCKTEKRLQLLGMNAT